MSGQRDSSEAALSFIPGTRNLLIADKRSRALVRFEQAAVLQFAISTHHSVRIDLKINGELAHRRQLISRAQRPACHCAPHLVDNLPINGYTALQVQVKVKKRILKTCSCRKQCTILLVHQIMFGGQENSPKRDFAAGARNPG